MKGVGVLLAALLAPAVLAGAGGSVGEERELDTCNFTSHRLHEAKNVVVVLGLNGEGKSTFIHFLAHWHELVAVPDDATLGFRIEGGKTSGLNLTLSPTLMPELIQSENLSFVDNPGLEGSGGLCSRVKQAMAVTAVLRNAEKVKIIVVLDYNDLDPKTTPLGARLLTTAKILAHLIKRPLRYYNSIGLVLTRAPYQSCLPIFHRNVERLKMDARQSIDSLKKSVEREHVVLANGETYENVVELLSLFKHADSRLELLREPNATGLLQADYHTRDRRKLLEMIRALDFVTPDRGDFGHGLSDDVIPSFKSWLRRAVENLMTALKSMATEIVTEVVGTSRSALESGTVQWDGILCLEQLMHVAEVSKATNCTKFQAMPRLEHTIKYVKVISEFSDLVSGDYPDLKDPLTDVLKFSQQLKNCTEEYFVKAANIRCARERLKEISLDDALLRAPATVDLKMCGCKLFKNREDKFAIIKS